MVDLLNETSRALRKYVGNTSSVSVCVGGRPTYEFRNYPYEDLAQVIDFFFVMGYDLEFWDDYTCFIGGACSLATASIQDLSKGVQEYVSRTNIPRRKLVLGLPWYGTMYTRVAGVPFNEGEVSQVAE